MNRKWTTKKLGEVCEIYRGGSPRPIKQYITTEPNGINWIKIGDTEVNDKYINSTAEKIIPEGITHSRFVEKGDFLLSNSMSFGRPYILNIDGCIHDGWLVLKKYQEHFIIDFFYYLLRSPVVIQQFESLARGSTVRNLNTQLVSSVVVPVPPLSEQQRLVGILDKAFEQIDSIQKNAEQNLLHAQEMFQRVLEEQLLPKSDWKEYHLANLCKKIFAGGDAPSVISKYKTEQCFIPIYANAITNQGLYGYTDTPKVEQPALTVTARGNIGHVEIRKVPFVPIVRLIVLIPNNAITTIDFLYWALKNQIITQSGTSIPQLTVPELKQYQISVPPISLQSKIATLLFNLVEQCSQLESNYQRIISDCNELKKAILAQAFNGEL